MKKFVLQILPYGIVFVFGAMFALGFLTVNRNLTLNVNSKLVRYTFLSPRVTSDLPAKRLVNFTRLRENLNTYVSSDSGNIGVYFEYFPTGSNIGINERTPFTLASLLKVPVVMSIYQDIEDGLLSLDDTVTITPNMINKHFGSLWEKGPGTVISVKEAIQLALTESDNTANQVLLRKTSLESIGNIFSGFDIPTTSDGELVVTPKNYTSILRSLYFSTILYPKHSEEILFTLSQSKFTDTLSHAIPATIPVSHKIGIHELTGTYSDCGIVYIPDHRYALCIMIKNKPEAEAKKDLQKISEIVFQFITSAIDSL